jgi:hypothetical protein
VTHLHALITASIIWAAEAVETIVKWLLLVVILGSVESANSWSVTIMAAIAYHGGWIAWYQIMIGMAIISTFLTAAEYRVFTPACDALVPFLSPGCLSIFIVRTFITAITANATTSHATITKCPN